MTANTDLPVPHLLTELVARGQWPGTDEEVRAQESMPRVSPATIKSISPEEDGLVLEAPPFRTLAAEMGQEPSDFWLEHGALDEIAPELALVIGDFGSGSDAPIILDYRDHGRELSVLRLHWSIDGNHWVLIDPSFEGFVARLGLRRS